MFWMMIDRNLTEEEEADIKKFLHKIRRKDRNTEWKYQNGKKPTWPFHKKESQAGSQED